MSNNGPKITLEQLDDGDPIISEHRPLPPALKEGAKWLFVASIAGMLQENKVIGAAATRIAQFGVLYGIPRAAFGAYELLAGVAPERHSRSLGQIASDHALGFTGDLIAYTNGRVLDPQPQPTTYHETHPIVDVIRGALDAQQRTAYDQGTVVVPRLSE